MAETRSDADTSAVTSKYRTRYLPHRPRARSARYPVVDQGKRSWAAILPAPDEKVDLLGRAASGLDTPSCETTLYFHLVDDGQLAIAPQLGTFGMTRVVGTLPGQILTGALSGPAVVVAADVVALEVPRVGTPPNPMALLPGLTSGPIIASVWDPVVDHTGFMPAALIDILGITIGPSSFDIPTSFGTILVNLSGPVIVLTRPAGMRFPIPIPPKCSLIGASLSIQAVSHNSSFAKLTNALDVTIGTE